MGELTFRSASNNTKDVLISLYLNSPSSLTTVAFNFTTEQIVTPDTQANLARSVVPVLSADSPLGDASTIQIILDKDKLTLRSSTQTAVVEVETPSCLPTLFMLFVVLSYFGCSVAWIAAQPKHASQYAPGEKRISE